jgi:superfamily II RNA helicase
MRLLQGHEYNQSSGRSGRLGLDKVGHAIHLNNLFRNVDHISYKTMMNGKPQMLTSKFKISYNLLLNLLDIGDNNLVNFAKKSMITGDLDNQMKQIQNEITKNSVELDSVKQYYNILKTPKEIIEEYVELQNKRPHAVNKKRKEIERSLEQIKDNYKFIEQDKITHEKVRLKEEKIVELQKEYNNTNSYFNSGVQTVLNLLKSEGYIDGECNDETSLHLTIKGKMASQLRETHCLVFSKLFEDKTIDNLTSKQLVCLFSCFTNISVQEEKKDNFPKTDDTELKDIVHIVSKLYSEYQQKEVDNKINTGIDYTIHYDLLNYVDKWCDCESIENCKLLLQTIGAEKEIFLGEFVKALLKINNITCEMEKIAELSGNIAFLSKLKEIPNMTLKYVVTNQSLYV